MNTFSIRNSIRKSFEGMRKWRDHKILHTVATQYPKLGVPLEKGLLGMLSTACMDVMLHA